MWLGARGTCLNSYILCISEVRPQIRKPLVSVTLGPNSLPEQLCRLLLWPWQMRLQTSEKYPVGNRIWFITGNQGYIFLEKTSLWNFLFHFDFAYMAQRGINSILGPGHREVEGGICLGQVVGVAGWKTDSEGNWWMCWGKVTHCSLLSIYSRPLFMQTTCQTWENQGHGDEGS